MQHMDICSGVRRNRGALTLAAGSVCLACAGVYASAGAPTCENRHEVDLARLTRTTIFRCRHAQFTKNSHRNAKFGPILTSRDLRGSDAGYFAHIVDGKGRSVAHNTRRGRAQSVDWGRRTLMGRGRNPSMLVQAVHHGHRKCGGPCAHGESTMVGGVLWLPWRQKAADYATAGEAVGNGNLCMCWRSCRCNDGGRRCTDVIPGGVMRYGESAARDDRSGPAYDRGFRQVRHCSDYSAHVSQITTHG